MKVHLLIRSEPPCPYCVKAKTLLDEQGIAFTFEDHETPEKVAAFKALGHTTFPRVYIDGSLVGGASELEEYLAF